MDSQLRLFAPYESRPPVVQPTPEPAQNIFEHEKQNTGRHDAPDFVPPNGDAEPTDAPPGTEARIAVYAYRLSHGMPLHVEGDVMDYGLDRRKTPP